MVYTYLSLRFFLSILLFIRAGAVIVIDVTDGRPTIMSDDLFDLDSSHFFRLVIIVSLIDSFNCTVFKIY